MWNFLYQETACLLQTSLIDFFAISAIHARSYHAFYASKTSKEMIIVKIIDFFTC